MIEAPSSSPVLFYAGFGAVLAGLAGYFVPSIRNAEDVLPDHDELEKAETPEVEIEAKSEE